MRTKQVVEEDVYNNQVVGNLIIKVCDTDMLSLFKEQ